MANKKNLEEKEECGSCKSWKTRMLRHPNHRRCLNERSGFYQDITREYFTCEAFKPRNGLTISKGKAKELIPDLMDRVNAEKEQKDG